MNIFFTADTHFGHKGQAERRGFDNLEAHDQSIVDNWNCVVKPGDEVWHLGDFAMCNPRRLKLIVPSLHGQIHLIPGNHDSKQSLKILEQECGVKVYPPIYRRHFPGTTQKVVLCHYPLLTWPSAHYGAWHLHGHSHGNLGTETSTRTDVAWDASWGRAPIPWEDLAAGLLARSYRSVDHHKVYP